MFLILKYDDRIEVKKLSIGGFYFQQNSLTGCDFISEIYMENKKKITKKFINSDCNKSSFK